jgi:hypothetical protein
VEDEILEKKIPHFAGMSMKFWVSGAIALAKGACPKEKTFIIRKKKLDKKRAFVYNGHKIRVRKITLDRQVISSGP